jgi:hypothetical protein
VSPVPDLEMQAIVATSPTSEPCGKAIHIVSQANSYKDRKAELQLRRSGTEIAAPRSGVFNPRFSVYFRFHNLVCTSSVLKNFRSLKYQALYEPATNVRLTFCTTDIPFRLLTTNFLSHALSCLQVLPHWLQNIL